MTGEYFTPSMPGPIEQLKNSAILETSNDERVETKVSFGGKKSTQPKATKTFVTSEDSDEDDDRLPAPLIIRHRETQF